jgi:hypothetical protein
MNTSISQTVKRFSSLQKRKFNTPQFLKAGLYMTWGASLLLATVIISGVQSQRQAIQIVGKDAIPSILTAQRIKDALLGMDANAVNELLIKPGEDPQSSKLTIEGYEERRHAFAERIILAASNITYGDAERKPIQTLQFKVGDYIAKLQRARDFNERGDTNGALIAYREAAQIIDNTLIPAADELDRVNLQELNKIYSQQGIKTTGSLVLIFITGGLLLGVLVTTQVFLYLRMRRILNPMLLGASAIAFLFLAHSAQLIVSASQNLRVAKEDAFNSLYALRQSRALVYSMNADESRYLLDKVNAAKHEQAFFARAEQVIKLPTGIPWSSVTAKLAAGNKVDGLSGFFGTGVNNITFAGEREAMIGTISTFGTYLDIDRQIRQLQQSGKYAEAVKLGIGYNPGQSNFAFDKFKDAHQKMQQINQKELDKAIKQGFQDINGFEIKAVVAAIAISVLALLGMRDRIKEYEI